MRRLAGILIVLIVTANGACERRASLDSLYSAAATALRRGDLDAALARIDEAASRVRSGVPSVDGENLRLLRTEVLLARPDLPRVRDMLAGAVPDGPEFAAARARHRYLTARLQLAEGKLADALQTLSE